LAASSDNLLAWLQDFYLSLCNGEWEHEFGFQIENLDNPGWFINFSLEDTPLDNVPFDSVVIERTEHDWIHCKVEDKAFKGRGGPKNLIELITVFRTWAESTVS
jgi:Immunity protein 53